MEGETAVPGTATDKGDPGEGGGEGEARGRVEDIAVESRREGEASTSCLAR